MTGNEEDILAEFFVMEELEEGEIVSDEESIFDEPAEAPIEEEEMEETLVSSILSIHRNFLGGIL
jgi:predicted nucleotidyltransferase